ncbi:MAG: DUF4331 domain-containing protein [Actinomycetes bacterium]
MLAAIGVAVTTAGALIPRSVSASSHREAPLIANEPAVDTTDVYAFVPKSAPKDVAFIANWFPFEHPTGGPNFYMFSPQAYYDINIDNDGDARPDVIYRWQFKNHYRNPNQFLYNTGAVTSLTDPDLNFYQTYTVTEITGQTTRTLLKNAIAAPSDAGAASIPNYGSLRNQATYQLHGEGETYAGQADDPFFLDLRVFDLAYGGNFSEAGHDTLSGFNVNTVVLKVPQSDVALNGNVTRNPAIGVWSTTERASTLASPGSATTLYKGSYVQVSRLGNPLVNEVVVPIAKKDKFNASLPIHDGQFLSYVTNPILPNVVQAVYGIPAPATPRNDLVEVFLTGIYSGSSGPVHADLNSQLINKDVNPNKFVGSDELRLNMAVPPAASPDRLGVLNGDLAGFPNGRRLGDDVIDIALQAAEGVLLPGHPSAVDSLGDGVDANDVSYSNSFPYVALPHSGSDTGPRG